MYIHRVCIHEMLDPYIVAGAIDFVFCVHACPLESGLEMYIELELYIYREAMYIVIEIRLNRTIELSCTVLLL